MSFLCDASHTLKKSDILCLHCRCVHQRPEICLDQFIYCLTGLFLLMSSFMHVQRRYISHCFLDVVDTYTSDGLNVAFLTTDRTQRTRMGYEYLHSAPVPVSSRLAFELLAEVQSLSLLMMTLHRINDTCTPVTVTRCHRISGRECILSERSWAGRRESN